MKSLINKMIIVSFVLSLSVAVQAEISNAYYYAAPLSALSIQPTPDDLAQLPGSTNYIVKGAMHVAMPEFGYLFNSDAVGSYGPGENALFQDGMSPDFDTAFHCDFDSPKAIGEVRVFTHWGDQRVFSWIEVWGSTTGTNEVDYSYLGTATLGELGQSNTVYVGQECVARLYDPDDGVIASGIVSLMLVQKCVGYGISAGLGDKLAPGTPLGSYVSIAGTVSPEIDIIEAVTIVNENYSELALGDLPYQPQSDDLAQDAGTTASITFGGMSAAWADNQFAYFFNSPTDGDLGTGSSSSEDGHGVLTYDAGDPETKSLTMHIDFASPKPVMEIRIFSLAGDTRLFNYGEVSYSTTGTNPGDYTDLGVVSFGEWDEYYYDYANSNCLARLLDSDDGILAENVTSLEITLRGIMNNWTWADWQKKQPMGGGSVIGEIDIIGIPEPATILIGGLFLGLAFLRRR